MLAGHVLMPARASATAAARVAFVALVAGTGALAGWRERRARDFDGDAHPGPQRLWMVAGLLAALVAASGAYWLAHGH